MKKIVVLIASAAFLFSACKQDFKLTSNWKEQMVIFGLLNQSDTVQYIRINKTFLGEGNAYTMAAIHDSINYKYLLNVRVEEWNNGSFVGSLPVDTTTLIPQDPGTFANQPQVLYRLHTPASHPLNDNSVYKLSVTNPRTGYTASGQTVLVAGVESTSLNPGAMAITKPLATAPYFDFYNTAFPYNFEYQTGVNGRLYQFVLRFHYTEYYSNSTQAARYIDKDFGQNMTNTPNGGEIVDYYFAWTDFTNLFAAEVQANPNVVKRVFGNCEMIISVASDEFNTYLSVNQPVSSITGDKPTYTNLLNAVGLFSSRYVYDDAHYNRPLAASTINNAVADPRICALHFADNSGTVVCP